MATLFRKRRLWWLNYSVDGKRYRVSAGTKDRKLALVKLSELEVKLFKGQVGDKYHAKKNESAPAFFRRFVEYYRGSHAADIHGEISRLKYFQEFIARENIRYLSEITPSALDEFMTSVLNGRKPKTKKNYIGILKTAMNKAVEWGLIEQNPLAKVKAPKIVKTFHFFHEDEIQKLIKEAEEPLRTAIIILVNTGLRRAELYSLRWEDVDFKNKRIRVWPYSGFTPKGKRPRSIPMSKTLEDILKSFHKKAIKSEFVYRPFQNQSTVYEHFAKLLKRLGMKGTLHDLRHTFASHLAMAGVSIPVIKELLGHSDITTTMIYAHLSPNVHKDAIAKLPF